MRQPTAQPPASVVGPRDALEFLNRAGTVLAASLDYEQTLHEVAQLAVPDVADWCAVYVTGDDGSQREITSRHPDAAIERALVEIRAQRRERGAGSETAEVARTGKSVLAVDVRGSTAEDATPEQRAELERLGARSYMIVPLLARGRVIGALTLLSTREGRHYSAEDLRFAETLAVRCALAIENARLYDTAARSLGLLDTLFASAPVGLAFIDADRRYVRINEALADMNGVPLEAHLGRTVEEVLGPLAGPTVEAHRTVMASGEPLLGVEREGVFAEEPGRSRHLVASLTPVRAGAGGPLIGVGMTVIDVTERRALLDAEREARLRADFLARAGAILDSSLDYEQTLANVAQIAVPAIADWCAVAILDDSGVLRELAAAHADPAKRALGRELSERFPPDPDLPTGATTVARTGETQLVREVTDEMLVAGVRDPEQLELVRALGLRSVLMAPLKTRQRSFGTLTLASAESGRLFDEADVQLAGELARRAGAAIENARLYTERTRIAHTLQVRLLPERLPAVPGAVTAARYRAAGELIEVGGDFYDVFPRAGGGWALVVGDVSGKGAEAAAMTALARYTLRAVAREGASPSHALARLHETMLAEAASQFATVVLAYVSMMDAGARVRLALGGHPPPLVLRAGGGVEQCGKFGSLLGAHEGASFVDTDVTLTGGDTLLLYTDGVTEAGPRTAPLGEAGLARLAAGLCGRDPQAVVNAVEAAVVAAQAGEPRDDLALLALSVAR